MESPEQGLKLTLPVYAQVIRGQYERLKHVKSDNDILETASALKAFLSDPDAYGRETFNPVSSIPRTRVEPMIDWIVLRRFLMY